MKLAPVIAWLRKIEEALTVEIEGLGEHKIVRTYQLLADKDGVEPPCFMHNYSFEPIRIGGAAPNGLRVRRFVLTVQAFIAPLLSGSEQWSVVAGEFDEAFQLALAQHLKLDEPGVMVDNLRPGGESGTIVTVLNWHDQPYVGLDYLLDVTIHDTVLVGP